VTARISKSKECRVPYTHLTETAREGKEFYISERGKFEEERPKGGKEGPFLRAVGKRKERKDKEKQPGEEAEEKERE